MPPSKPSSTLRNKRPLPQNDATLSPPPLKRKAQPAISKSAVANFFTPTSQKPKDRTTWTERCPDGQTPATLLVARYVPEKPQDEAHVKRRKIAMFDLDSTLITSASGKKFADSATDWKWWNSSVPSRLQKLYNEEGYLVTVFTNQAGLTLHPDPKAKAPKNAAKDRVSPFKQRCNAVLSHLDIPLTIYAATGKDIFRKPRPGMWTELLKDYELDESAIDRQASIFVGDAGGRTALLRGGTTIPKDFSCSDRNFAHNVGIRYQAPEEFFLREEPRAFTRDFNLAKYPFTEGDPREAEPAFEKINEKDIVIFCGPPGAGKSSFYWNHLKPLGYERVNQDILGSREKCLKVAAELLEEGKPVAVDNTNADPEVRFKWVELANKHGVPIRCVWFKVPLQLCEHNDAVRSLNKLMNPESRRALPRIAFSSFGTRYKEPKLKEGFRDIIEVEFRFHGTREEYDIWGRYWV